MNQKVKNAISKRMKEYWKSKRIQELPSKILDVESYLNNIQSEINDLKQLFGYK
jgi:cell division protein FtsL